MPDWQEFSPDTFAEAKRRNRPVLLVITQAWCPHSRRLIDECFTSPNVETICDQAFLPVQVDAERRPDVNERYGTGSWPTIAFVTPGGDLISNQGFLEADELAEQLGRISDYIASNREEIERTLKSMWEQPNERSVPHSGRLNQQIIDDVVDSIYDKFDHRYGGWGDGAKFPHPESIDFALVQVVKHDDDRMRSVVTTTLDKMAEGAIHDPIDGGFFRFSKTPDWRSPDFEKVLDANAMRLRCYLEAYQLFKTETYERAARGIVDWMLGFMRDPDTGAFFGTQDADAEYYALDAAGRDARARPKLDRTIYANGNAMTISALLKASIVLDAPALRDTAIQALSFLTERMFDERTGVYHYWDSTYHLPGMLSDQAYLIRALIDAAQHTGNSDYLIPAEQIAEMAIERQKAPNGGFYDILDNPHQQGSMRRRNRSILENSVMSEALLRLACLSRRPEFHDEAAQALASFTSDYKRYGYYVAGYGRAVDLIVYQPLVITIVGDRNSEAADNLRRAALAPYVPSRIVQMLDPAHDPILLARSGFPIERSPVAYFELGGATKASADSSAEVEKVIATIELGRR